MYWIDNNGKDHKFEIRKVWSDMISNDQKVDWCSVVQFEQCIPKHAFVLWLAIQKRLLTQNRILIWKPNENLKCAFCYKCPDSHNHLFFTCDYSKSIWKEVQKLLNKNLPNSLDQIVIALTKLPATKNIWSVLRRLVCGATVYAIWLERNKRLFTGEKRDEKTIFNSIKETVGMQMLSFTVKDSRSVKEVEAKWELKLQRMSSML